MGGGGMVEERDMCVSECVCEKNILRKRDRESFRRRVQVFTNK